MIFETVVQIESHGFFIKMQQKLQKYFTDSAMKQNLIDSNQSTTLRPTNFQTPEVFGAHSLIHVL